MVASCHTYKKGMSHVLICRVTHMNESCPLPSHVHRYLEKGILSATYKRGTSHMSSSHVSHTHVCHVSHTHVCHVSHTHVCHVCRYPGAVEVSATYTLVGSTLRLEMKVFFWFFLGLSHTCCSVVYCGLR